MHRLTILRILAGAARRGAISSDVKLWLAGGFAVLGLGAAVWSAIPQRRPERPDPRGAMTPAPPTDPQGRVVDANYRPARTAAQQAAMLQELHAAVIQQAVTIPSGSLAGAPEGLGDSTSAVLTMLQDPSTESINAMFGAMGGRAESEDGEPRDFTMLEQFITNMFDRGELDLDRMVVRPKPDDDEPDGPSEPERVARNAETRQRQASQRGPGESRSVSAIRLVGPYEGAEELAQTQRPIEVRVPYKPRGEDGERILALDLLFNPGPQTWQMVEMRFEQLEVGGDG